MKTLPDIELIYLVRDGNNTAFEILLKRYEPLIGSVIRNYYARDYEKEDFFQIGSLAFYQAIMSYDTSVGATFYGFALSCVRNKVVSAWRHEQDEINYATDYEEPLYLMESQADKTVPNSEIIAIMENDPGYKMRQQAREFLANEDILSDLESKCVELFFAGNNHEEIANQLGYSINKVQAALSRARRKIKKTDEIIFAI